MSENQGNTGSSNLGDVGNKAHAVCMDMLEKCRREDGHVYNREVEFLTGCVITNVASSMVENKFSPDFETALGKLLLIAEAIYKLSEKKRIEVVDQD